VQTLSLVVAANIWGKNAFIFSRVCPSTIREVKEHRKDMSRYNPWSKGTPQGYVPVQFVK